ncbi:MAG: glycosyltransferase family 2 protein [Candidatus Protochlamydia sp.]|nr:glycosyltransferase family 2 protein [Candidatus Protochlamydia sp.]
MTEPLIDILLATYQGAGYLKEQIDSIFSQTYSHFHLWIRDDLSSDATRSFLQTIENAHPNQVTLLASKKNVGVVQNFSTLLAASKADYICFADQDDQWFPDKLQCTLDQMKALEKQTGLATPLLVHTDLSVVSKDLALIDPSFWRYSNINPRLTSLQHLLTQNNMTGCTMMLNRPLADLVLPIPLEASMHDWWIALVAASFGNIGIVEKPTLYYRQHEQNDTGAKKYGIQKFLNESAKEKQKKQTTLKQTYRQAQVLLDRYFNSLNGSQKSILKAYASLENLPYLQRLKKIVEYRFFKKGVLRNLKWIFIP